MASKIDPSTGKASPKKAENSKDEAKPRKPVWREYGEALLWALILAFIIRTFVFQAFRIPSSSMEDTLLIGDYLFVNKFLYGAEIPFTGGARLPAVREPERGDIIVFRYPEDPSLDYIKRCVAVEGDTLLYRDKVLYVNGSARDEDFTKFVDGAGVFRPGLDAVGPLVVPEDHLFMMGDNRDRSSDSRVWGFLDTKHIRGKALFIYWSWDSNSKRPRITRVLDLVK